MDQQGVIRRPWPPLYAVLSLPGGVGGGFLAVAMGYRMSQEGIPVGAIAGVISLSVLPWTWKIFGGPVLDLVLTPRIWQAIATVAVAASLLAFAMAPTTALPLLSVLSLLSGTATVLNTVAVNNIVAATEPEEARAGLGGWVLTGGLGGKGLGGGAGLWLMQHDGLLASTVVLAVVSMTGILPLLAIRTAPPVRAATLKAEVRGLVREVWGLIRSRIGALALLLNVLPMGLGASNALWSAVAGDWKASADVVALVTGVLGGLVTVPGCLLGTLLCRYFTPRAAYYGSAVAGAAILVGMALAPHTPWAFAIFTLASALILGTTWATLQSVTFVCLGTTAAASKASLIGSASNLPVVVGIALVGAVQSRYGSNAMLYCEAAMAAGGLVFYTLVSQATQSRAAPAVIAASA